MYMYVYVMYVCSAVLKRSVPERIATRSSVGGGGER
jgi:hypothetical protein